MGSDRLVSRDGDGLTVGDVLKQHGLDASDASLKKLAFTSSQVWLLWPSRLGKSGTYLQLWLWIKSLVIVHSWCLSSEPGAGS